MWISDHFHPWNDEQGHSPFVWTVIGALSQACDLPVTTAVTCPTVRIHPAIIAQAAATAACMLDGRFILGVGTGEALNEHVLGDVWPSVDVRLEMLEEAVHLIRRLWEGDFVTERGRHYEVDTARIYTRPDQPPPIYMSGFGPKATDVAARIADGYISTKADADLLSHFKKASGGKPAQVGCKVAYARTADEGVDLAYRLWRNAGLPGELAQVLPSPQAHGAGFDTRDQGVDGREHTGRARCRRTHFGVAGVRRRRLRRGLRRQHGPALPRDDPVLRT